MSSYEDNLSNLHNCHDENTNVRSRFLSQAPKKRCSFKYVVMPKQTYDSTVGKIIEAPKNRYNSKDTSELFSTPCHPSQRAPCDKGSMPTIHETDSHTTSSTSHGEKIHQTWADCSTLYTHRIKV